MDLVVKSKNVVIWQVKQAPHWGVQSRFCVIYVSMSVGMYVGLSTENTYAKICGMNNVAQTRACSKSVLGN